MNSNRPTAIVTGACGGMARAWARMPRSRFGLLLTDVDQARIDNLAHALVEEGCRIFAGVACDLTNLTRRSG